MIMMMKPYISKIKKSSSDKPKRYKDDIRVHILQQLENENNDDDNDPYDKYSEDDNNNSNGTTNNKNRHKSRYACNENKLKYDNRLYEGIIIIIIVKTTMTML